VFPPILWGKWAAETSNFQWEKTIRDFHRLIYGTKNGCISWTKSICTSKFLVSQYNLSPLSIATTCDSFRDGSKIAHLKDRQWNSPYGLWKIPVADLFGQCFPSITTWHRDEKFCPSGFPHKSIFRFFQTKIGIAWENWIDPIWNFHFCLNIANESIKTMIRPSNALGFL